MMTPNEVVLGIPAAIEKLLAERRADGPQIFWTMKRSRERRYFVHYEQSTWSEIFFIGMNAIHKVAIFGDERALVDPLDQVSHAMLRACLNYVFLQKREVGGKFLYSISTLKVVRRRGAEVQFDLKGEELESRLY